MAPVTRGHKLPFLQGRQPGKAPAGKAARLLQVHAACRQRGVGAEVEVGSPHCSSFRADGKGRPVGPGHFKAVDEQPTAAAALTRCGGPFQQHKIAQAAKAARPGRGRVWRRRTLGDWHLAAGNQQPCGQQADGCAQAPGCQACPRRLPAGDLGRAETALAARPDKGARASRRFRRRRRPLRGTPRLQGGPIQVQRPSNRISTRRFFLRAASSLPGTADRCSP